MKEETKGYQKNLEEKFRDFLVRWPKLHELYCKYEEILVYLVVGGVTTVVSYACKFLTNWLAFGNPSHPTPLQNLILSIVAWVTGVAVAYPANRVYVFRSHGSVLAEIPKFVASRVSTLFLDMAIMQILGFLGVNVYISTAISFVLVMVGNYVFSKVFVFRKK